MVLWKHLQFLSRRVPAARRALLLFASAPLLAWAAFAGVVAWWPYPSELNAPPTPGAIVEDRHGVPLLATVDAAGQWRAPLAYDEISPHLLDAVVAVEDERFYSHHGIDWRSAAGALWEDLRGQRIRRGASTITMQLQRLRDPRPRTVLNKIEQAIRAAQLERQAGKKELLMEYINRAPFGGNLAGAGAASWRYFGRPCRELSLGEAALLAGLPQSPNRCRPDRFPVRALARRSHVLDRMLACGRINRRQRDEAAAEPVAAQWRHLPQDRPPGDLPAADAGLAALCNLAAHGPAPLFRTTIDAVLQRQTARAAVDHLRSLQGSGISAASVVVLDTQTAECLATVSLGTGAEAVDLTRRMRSTGSALKPFIYAAAFEQGICEPGTVLSDMPAAWPGYMPSDYDLQFRGDLTAAEALAESRNIPALVVLNKLGVEPAVEIMDAAGFHGLARRPGRYGLSLAIGGAEATPMEMAEAYALLGRGGIARAAHLWSEEEESPPGPALRILSADACWQTLRALSDVPRTARVCIGAARTCVAWKTGTSSGHRDAWCAAVTRRFTVVVWLGNAGGQSSAALVGQDAAAPLALRLIAALDKSNAEPWPEPAAAPFGDRPGPSALPDPTLVLVSPAEGQQFVLDESFPAARQRVHLKAVQNNAAGGRYERLWWFIDGQPLEPVWGDDGAWWPPSPGSHEVRVVDAKGRCAVAHFSVRG